jgi:hypothetical protein
MFDAGLRGMTSGLTRWWWVYLVAGVVWLIIAVIVLRLDLTSVFAIGVLLGVLFLVTALDEFAIAALRDSWRWFRVLLGIFFIAGAIWCFIHPYNAFWSIAAALGILLVIKGAFDIVNASASSLFNHIWWLGLIAGLLEIALGFWASQQYVATRAALLLLWAGLYAIFRGVSDLVIAFEVERTHKAVS